MSALLGLWARSGCELTSLVGEQRLCAMVSQLDVCASRRPALSGVSFQIYADPAKSTHKHKLWRGYEGFVTKRDWSGPLTPAWRNAPDGHFVLAEMEFQSTSDQAPMPSKLRLLRAISGGERLYTIDDGKLFMFASSIRPLLAFIGQSRRFNITKLRASLLTGIPSHGASLIEGIDEVPPGHLLEVDSESSRLTWFYQGLLLGPQGDHATLARQYRDKLTECVAEAAGSARPVVVTLSGGIDSSAIAAAAVDAFGASQVHAFTYEFDDAEHPVETHFARQVSSRLGLTKHHVYRIKLADFVNAIPETVWRSESTVNWPKAFMLPVARKLRSLGFEQQLSGFGIGSHLGYFRDFSSLFRFWPVPGHWLRYWTATRNFAVAQQVATRLHPGFEPPSLRTLQLLRRCLQPGSMKAEESRLPPLVRELFSKLPMDDSEPLAKSQPNSIESRLGHHALFDLTSCVDVTRWEKVTRELGCHRISPAHFVACLPHAYLPYQPALPLGNPERQARPGKHLLRLAYRGVLPDSVLYRKKSWADAVISPAWLAAGARWMREALPTYPCGTLAGAVEPHIAREYAPALALWDKRSPQMTVTALAFWQHLFLERELSSTPPSWSELIADRLFDMAA